MIHHLVDLRSFIPGIQIDLRYASKNNFTKKQIYDLQQCLLHEDAACLLKQVQEDLVGQGLGLKVWDAFRPMAAQWKLWEIVPDERYVSDPRKGGIHTRGVAVDVTLVDSQGIELPMPTDFDHFGEEAYSDFRGCLEEMIVNRDLLREAMETHGFLGIPTEWWHFHLPKWADYPPIDWI